MEETENKVVTIEQTIDVLFGGAAYEKRAVERNKNGKRS